MVYTKASLNATDGIQSSYIKCSQMSVVLHNYSLSKYFLIQTYLRNQGEDVHGYDI